MDEVLGSMQTYDHEQLVFCNDNETGLRAIIGIHNTVLGPALGGTRMWDYSNEAEALTDVLRLSRGMTYKAAAAGLDLGGGKAVILGDPKKIKTEKLLLRFGKFIEGLAGRYITAGDVGMNSGDMISIGKATKYVTGLPGKSGDPSPITALGVYYAMKACAKEKWGNDSLSGKRIVVQGIGNVGENLVKLIAKEGAKVSISDIDEARTSKVAKENGASVLNKDLIFDETMDIYAPCALGAVINSDSLKKLKCEVVCGAANNQLADEQLDGMEIMKKGILYAPDFVINAGGLISVSSEISGLSAERVIELTKNIYGTTLNIFKVAGTENIPTYAAANRIAEKRIGEKKRGR